VRAIEISSKQNYPKNNAHSRKSMASDLIRAGPDLRSEYASKPKVWRVFSANPPLRRNNPDFGGEYALYMMDKAAKPPAKPAFGSIFRVFLARSKDPLRSKTR
jgi:hypothetical protein